RKALFGPLSTVIKILVFDFTYSLFSAETRRRWISWFATPLAILGLIELFANFVLRKNEINGFRSLSWEWGETFLLFFLALHSLASAVFMMRRTSTLFFLEFYEAWSECAKLAPMEVKDANANGDPEGGKTPTLIPRYSVSRLIFVTLAFLVFIWASASTSIKYT
ncbi:hypothetical protein PMAYCL1PPCAC_32760, partial [Pristionchus mayeri]